MYYSFESILSLSFQRYAIPRYTTKIDIHVTVADPRGGGQGGEDPPEISGKKFLHMEK